MENSDSGENSDLIMCARTSRQLRLHFCPRRIVPNQQVWERMSNQQGRLGKCTIIGQCCVWMPSLPKSCSSAAKAEKNLHVDVSTNIFPTPPLEFLLHVPTKYWSQAPLYLTDQFQTRWGNSNIFTKKQKTQKTVHWSMKSADNPGKRKTSKISFSLFFFLVEMFFLNRSELVAFCVFLLNPLLFAENLLQFVCANPWLCAFALEFENMWREWSNYSPPPHIEQNRTVNIHSSVGSRVCWNG